MGADIGGRSIEPGSAAGQDRHIVTASGELADGGATHPSRPTGHHGHLATLRHELSPFRVLTLR
jgi:hypothetical protein